MFCVGCLCFVRGFFLVCACVRACVESLQHRPWCLITLIVTDEN